MEYAMIEGTEKFEGKFYAPLKAKLAYYCEAIREAFDTTGWPEITPWERPLHS